MLNVASTGVPWPQTGTFTIQLQNTVLTLLRVTAINSGTQWAVTPEANDLSTSAGTTVLGTVLSAAACTQMVSQVANLPLVPPISASWTCYVATCGNRCGTLVCKLFHLYGSRMRIENRSDSNSTSTSIVSSPPSRVRRKNNSPFGVKFVVSI
jgi:hypothetical protein